MSVINEVPQDNNPVEPDPKTHKQMLRWPWLAWFNSVYITCFSTQESGVTANRPTTNLWIGRRYFDTSLGKPVYLKSTGPNVWVDGVGTVS